MQTRMRISFVLTFLTSLFAQNSLTPTDVRGWMNQGIQAYKNLQFDQAIEAFENAINLDPSSVSAHLYLGTALMVTFIPGAQLPDSAARAERARGEFLRVLGLEPNNQTALFSLAQLGMKEAEDVQDQPTKFQKLDEARDWFLRVLSADPHNRDTYYSLGVIDWIKWYPNFMTARANLGMKLEDPGPLPGTATRLDLRLKYGPMIEDGITNLNKALEIDPAYDDAMAYMNLLIRERADLRDSPEEYRSDIKEAEQWYQKALAAKRTAQTTAHNQARFPPLPPARSTSDSAPTRIRVGGNVQAPNLIQKVDPVYPPLAVQARIQGTVHFTAIIGKDGRILNLQLIGGHPLLVQAAQDAVKQWVYKPTDLNGTPVEVVTQVDVQFTLPDAR
jgi:TonB family protein